MIHLVLLLIPPWIFLMTSALYFAVRLTSGDGWWRFPLFVALGFTLLMIMIFGILILGVMGIHGVDPPSRACP